MSEMAEVSEMSEVSEIAGSVRNGSNGGGDNNLQCRPSDSPFRGRPHSLQ